MPKVGYCILIHRILILPYDYPPIFYTINASMYEDIQWFVIGMILYQSKIPLL